MRLPLIGVMVLALGVAIAAQTRPPASAQGRGARPPAQPRPTTPAAQRVDPQTDPRAATARRLCGVCHPFETVVAIRRTKSQWEATVENMIGRGARGTPAEFATAIDFLSDAYGLSAGPVRGMGAGPEDKPLVDPKASEMGKPVYAQACLACHGPDAR